MKAVWWQDGIHLSPDSTEEREALVTLWRALEGIQVHHDVPTGPVGAVGANDQERMVEVEEKM